MLKGFKFNEGPGGGGQSDKKVLPCADLAINFIPFSRITIFGKYILFKDFFAENF